ncbi:MAG TPA: DNA repair protein RecO [Candidatus Omnitrophica bacterium]|nr:DNA repair protein RecO [Candidatus Omnitrophota bacterium]
MICSTPAFLLRAFDFRETSKIVTFFTRDFGKVKGILKGVRKDPRKFSTTLSPLSLNHIVFYRKRNTEIHLVGQCDQIDDFGMLTPSLKTFGFASHIAELVDCLMPLEDAHAEVFELIFDFLNTLKGGTADTRPIFQIKILSLSGFKPHFDSCLACDAKIERDAFFSRSRGGLLCGRCCPTDRHAEAVLQGSIATLLYIERSEWSKALRLNMSSQIRGQLEGILTSFINFHVGRALKTSRPVHELIDLAG